MKNFFPFSPAADILSPRIDFVFKLLFGSEQNKDILAAFLTSILDIPADEFGNLTLKNPVLQKNRRTEKGGILDIRLTTKSGKHINIEMQVLDTPSYQSRVLFYLSRMIGEQLAGGEGYGNLNKTISISVLNFELIRDSITYKNVYRLYDKNSGSLFTDLLEVITLELPKIPENAVNDPVIPWLKFIGLHDKEDAVTIVEKYPELHKAYERLQELSLDENNHAEYEMHLKWYMDEVNLLSARDTAEEMGYDRGIKDGIEQGLQQGISQGISQGIEQGLQQGISQGARQARQENARKLHAMGLSLAHICEATGLTEKEVIQILHEL